MPRYLRATSLAVISFFFSSRAVSAQDWSDATVNRATDLYAEWHPWLVRISETITTAVIILALVYAIRFLMRRTMNDKMVTVGKALAIALGGMFVILLQPVQGISDALPSYLTRIPWLGYVAGPITIVGTFVAFSIADALLRRTRGTVMEGVYIVVLAAAAFETLTWFVDIFKQPSNGDIPNSVSAGVVLGSMSYVAYWFLRRRTLETPNDKQEDSPLD